MTRDNGKIKNSIVSKLVEKWQHFENRYLSTPIKRKVLDGKIL